MKFTNVNLPPLQNSRIAKKCVDMSDGADDPDAEPGPSTNDEATEPGSSSNTPGAEPASSSCDPEAEKSSNAVEHDINYKDCCLFDKSINRCGPCYIRDNISESGLTRVENLTSRKIVEKYLKSIGLKELPLKILTEKRLIENRLKRHLEDGLSICPYHRDMHGVGWRQTHKKKHCMHPDHPEYKRGTKTCATELAPYWMVKSINETDPSKPHAFTYGGNICRKHKLLKPKATTIVEDDDDDEIADTSQEDAKDLDESFQPDEVLINEGLKDQSLQVCNQLTTMLGISPIHWQVTKTPASKLGERSKDDLRKKLFQVKEAAVRVLAEGIAPTQGENLIQVLHECAEDPDEDVPSDIRHQINVYKESDSQGKLVILSLLDQEKYTKEQIQTYFGCTKYAVDKARRLKKTSKGLAFPETKQKIRRNRLNISKCEHFLEFLFSSGIVQDVAYGVANVRFDSGSVQKIPNAILTTKYSHAIAFYLEICRKCEYESLSESTLWRILRTLKPSQRKSLAGLDDITAAGMNGFSQLIKFVDDRKRFKDISDRLERGKRYLKTNYQQNCSIDSDIASHNPLFALSTEKEEELNVQISENVCKDCYDLISALSDVKEIARNEGDEDAIYDVKLSVQAVLTYMKHQMRDYQQRQAKAYCFDRLDAETGFWLKDFAQKILPMRFREGQREYFGKKGMSLHIDVLFRKQNESLLKYVYLTCLFRCKQSAIDVLNIGDVVLQAFKKDCPMVTKLFGKSDNASCYHGNYVFEALFKLCRARSFQLLRYDFNEPCKGKDQCDRESAGSKTVLNSYVNNGNDVLKAEDVFDGLHYGKGINNAQASVIESDLENSHLIGKEIKNVSSYHSIVYGDKSMKLYRYYNVGSGVKVDYADGEFIPSYNVKREFSHTQPAENREIDVRGKKKRKRDDHLTCSMIFCQNPLCSDLFETVQEYEEHLLSENHTIEKQETAWDSVRASYVEKIKVSSHLHSTLSSITESSIAEITLNEALVETPLMEHISARGWALPQRSKFEYTLELKLFLFDIFTTGEDTGIKKSAEEVEMMVRKNFNPDQYLTTVQIRTFFSKWTKELKAGTLKRPTEKKKKKPKVNQKVSDEDKEEVADDAFQIALLGEATRVIGDIAEWEVGDYVAIRNNSSYCPGLITKITEGVMTVSCMEFVNGHEMNNKFRWRTPMVETECSKDDIILTLHNPAECTRGKRASHFTLTSDDFRFIADLLKVVEK